MKKMIVLLVAAILTLMFLAASVSADQNGNDRWCNSDEYGCWVTEENGGKSYIMFWSEEARAFFMGGKAPRELLSPANRIHPAADSEWKKLRGL